MSLFYQRCSQVEANNTTSVDEKICGLSFVGPPKKLESGNYEFMTRVAADWVALIPYGFTAPGETQLAYNLSWQWWGEKKEGVIEGTRHAKNCGLKVMIKPQVWIRHGFFVGHYDLETEKQWQEWEVNFERFILDYAALADSVGADLFCIGTEWSNFVVRRPVFWKDLIAKVREVYSGPLTYAGNWDAYKNFPHWHLVDYIGIDAYFPLSDARVPTVKELEKGWKQVLPDIRKFTQKYNKPVLFTEYGYRSVHYTASKPWEHHRSNSAVSVQGQRNALEALYKTLWDEPWFAGGFLWNWYSNHESAGGNSDSDFTPQNKPAEAIVREWYGKY